MEMTIAEVYTKDPLMACRMALKMTVNLKGTYGNEDRIQEINKLLSGYGIQTINGKYQKGYWGNIVAINVNMGGSYYPTIIYTRNGKWIVSSVGDYVERNQKRFNIQ